LAGYKAPEVAEWNKYKDELKRKRKRKLQGTYTDLTATAPAFVDGLDEVGATRSTASNVERPKLCPDTDNQKSKLSVSGEEQKTLTSKLSLSASNSNSSFSSTSTTPYLRDGIRPPPPRLAPPANAARRRRVADSAEGDEVRIFVYIILEPKATECFIDLGKLNLLKISLPWSKSVKLTVYFQFKKFGCHKDQGSIL
jgi:hypothetical protein